MADSIRLVAPAEITANPDNPRLIFRSDELQSLEDSIALQGILVPLTVYEDSKGKLVILDGERRWRCSRRLGLTNIPVVVQPEPTRMQNVMMMFAIHNARQEWDPLPTAYKLRQLEELYFENEGRFPNESELAQLASMSRGEVRRLKNILGLPKRYLDDLLIEAEKPRSEQALTVDHVLEATRGAEALRKQEVLDPPTAEALTDALVEKFKAQVLRSTVEPRQLARLARGVAREEVTREAARQVVQKLITEPLYTVDEAYKDSVQEIDTQHALELQSKRLTEAVLSLVAEERVLQSGLKSSLQALRNALNQIDL
jgi:ParB family chromosome partitioning protein